MAGTTGRGAGDGSPHTTFLLVATVLGLGLAVGVGRLAGPAPHPPTGSPVQSPVIDRIAPVGSIVPTVPTTPPAPVAPTIPAGPAAELRRDVERIVAELRSPELTLTRWPGPARGASGECPVVLVDPGSVRSIRVAPRPGFRVFGPDGRPLATDSPLTLSVAGLREGLNWVRYAGPPIGSPGQLVVQRLADPTANLTPAGPGPTNLLFEKLSETIIGDPLRQSGPRVRQLIQTAIPDPADPFRKALLVWQELELQDILTTAADLATSLDDDPTWGDAERLARARAGLDVFQAAIEAAADRWNLWQNVGWILRRVPELEAGPARTALVRALSLWPESAWTWWTFARIERRLVKAPGSDRDAALHRQQALGYLRRAHALLDHGRCPGAWALIEGEMQTVDRELTGAKRPLWQILQGDPVRPR